MCYNRNMKILKRHITIAFRFTILTLSIGRTFVKRGLFRFCKKRPQQTHLQEFIERKEKNGCNLNALAGALNGQTNAALSVSNLVKAQNNYRSKQELLEHISGHPQHSEIIAIPIAITAFSFFRHFVTIIVDKRAGIIEFYDPIGFTTSQYKNAVLWGPKCPKNDLLKLEDLLISIKKHFQIETLIENTAIHQTDFTHCALFVYDRIYKRGVKGLSFNQAGRSPLSSHQAFA
ncbi:MAG: hypothetical protein SP4CHLAM5_08720 [Chlamydiia bacterium]|nr:hypothetical protein [Chlamydiia bacterium]MCH9618735.1 hypothetical protein [Chlamydiia bacterium]MCH9624525.1 hypothetical protein [Chlamydiia bacterium]